MIRYQSNDDYCSVDDIGAVYIFISIKVIKVTPCMSNGMDSSDEHTYGSIYIATLDMVIATTVIMEIIKTSRGKDKVCLDGQMYTQKLCKNEWVRWECVKRRGEGCKGAFTTDSCVLQYANPRSFVAHNHNPDVAAIEVSTLKAKLKERAVVGDVQPARLLAGALLNASDAAKDRIKIQTARRGIRRFKQGMVPPEPATRRQLNFVGPWTTTGGDNPRTFLFFSPMPEHVEACAGSGADRPLQHR